MTKEPVNTTMAHSNDQGQPSGKLLARAASCDVTPRDRRGPAGRLCFAQGPGLDHSRPDRDFGRSAGMRRTALPDLQLRSHDRGIRASGDDPRETATAWGFRPTRSCCWHRTPTARRRPIGPARVWECRTSNSWTIWLRPQKILCARLQRQQPSEVGLEIFQGQLNHSINRRRYWPFPTFGRTLRAQTDEHHPSHPTRQVPRTSARRSCCSAEPKTASRSA